jgi:hypothetical protein
MRISTLGIKERMREMPVGLLISTAIEDLWRVSRSEVGGGGLLVWAPGMARSMRRTEAPQSASRRPANGPGDWVVNMLDYRGVSRDKYLELDLRIQVREGQSMAVIEAL